MTLEPAPVLTAALSVRRPACVVDARLALSRFGLLAVTRLRGDVHVWLPYELRQILRDTSAYQEYAQRLSSPARRAADEIREIQAELALWRTWWSEAELSGPPLLYLGDHADECHTPPDTDRGLPERCEQLQRGLDRLARSAALEHPPGDTLAACFRDAVALAAALQAEGAFVLTRLEPGARAGAGPVLVDQLSAWGLRVAEAPSRGGPAATALRAVLARSGVSTLAWSGLRLAAVHVAVPGYPVVGGADARLDEVAMARVWTAAEVHWHEVS